MCVPCAASASVKRSPSIFAEKLEMDEIGTNGQEVHLQACPDG
jgi:hypothetical protein